IYLLGAALVAPALLWLTPLLKLAARLTPLNIRAPPLPLGGAALIGGVLDWVFSGLALFILMPEPTLARAAPFMAGFVLGSVVSAAAGAPGGIGVFEAVVLLLSQRFAVSAETAAALILYRLIYAVGPFSLVALGMVAHQAHHGVRKKA